MKHQHLGLRWEKRIFILFQFLARLMTPFCYVTHPRRMYGRHIREHFSLILQLESAFEANRFRFTCLYSRSRRTWAHRISCYWSAPAGGLLSVPKVSSQRRRNINAISATPWACLHVWESSFTSFVLASSISMRTSIMNSGGCFEMPR